MSATPPTAPPSPSTHVRPATAADLDALAALFDAYRQFYEQPADRERARNFLLARMQRGDSLLLVAEGEAPPPEAGADAAAPLLGFCQLYPTWCSVAAGPIFVLYDLFVAPGARRGGVARALMTTAAARATGALRLDLSTAHSNTRAQALYESLGWQLDEVFRWYSLAL